MSNDGSSEGGSSTSSVTFFQRTFLLGILSSGISVTLLKGAEYRDSKVGIFMNLDLRLFLKFGALRYCPLFTNLWLEPKPS